MELNPRYLTPNCADPAKAERYAALFRQGTQPAPIIVRRAPDGTWQILEGNHRTRGAQLANINFIDAELG